MFSSKSKSYLSFGSFIPYHGSFGANTLACDISAVISYVSSVLVDVPLVYRKTSGAGYEDYSDKGILNCPNPRATMGDIIQRIVTDLYECGNSFLYYDRGSLDGELVMIDPPTLSEAMNPMTGERRLIYTHLDKPNNNIIHFKINPGHDGLGVATLDKLSGLNSLLIKTDSYLAKVVGNPVRGFLSGARTSMVNKEISDADKRQIIQDISVDGGIFMNKNPTASALKFDRVDDSSIVDKLLAVRTNIRAQAAGVLGIPPSYLGLPMSLGGDLSLVFQSFITNCVSPIARSIADGFTLKLLTKTQRRNGYSIVFQLDKSLLSKLSDKVTTAAALVGGGLGSINEARGLIGFKPRKEDECNKVFYDKTNTDAVQNLMNGNKEN